MGAFYNPPLRPKDARSRQHPRTPHAARFTAEEEGFTWDFANIRQNDLSAPTSWSGTNRTSLGFKGSSVLLEEHEVDAHGNKKRTPALRVDFLGALHRLDERTDWRKNLAAAKIQAHFRGRKCRLAMRVAKDSYKTVDLIYLDRAIVAKKKKKHAREQRRLERERRAFVPGPTLRELRANRPITAPEPTVLSKVRSSAQLSYSLLPGGQGVSIKKGYNTYGARVEHTSLFPHDRSSLSGAGRTSSFSASDRPATVPADSMAGEREQSLARARRQKRRASRSAATHDGLPPPTPRTASRNALLEKSERWDRLTTPTRPNVEPGSFSEKAREEAGHDPNRIDRAVLMEMFLKADKDGSGALSRAEFLDLLKSLQLGEEDAALHKIIDECVDSDGDGSFGYLEALPTLLQVS